jgi:endonuclease/exonuclease/phosphatase family metal-dependent hydrolase
MRRLVLAVALAAAGCAMNSLPKDRSIESTFPKAPPVAELGSQFKVATFNIHMEPGAKVAKAIANDRALRDADVIVMQEVRRRGAGCSGACEIGKQLGYYALYTPGHAKGDSDYGVAVLSKAPITSATVLELPFFDVHFNGGRRVALIATVQHAGKPITIYAVHLDNRLDVDDRRAQMVPVLEHAKRQTTPVVIAGDFNTSPFTWIAHVIPVLTTTQDNHFERLIRKYGFDTPVKDSGPTHRYIGMKLDGIYTRGFSTRRFAVARASDVSDHMALWATLIGAPVPRTPAPRMPAPRQTVVPAGTRTANGRISPATPAASAGASRPVAAAP